MWRKRFKILKFSFLLLSIGCHSKILKEPSTLVKVLGTDPETLNVITSNSAYSSDVLGYISESLFSLYHDTLRPKPELATHWEVSPDHLVYTFYLRKNVIWHDGHPFTADDVLYAYEKIMDPKVDAGPIRSYWLDVVKVEKLSDHAVRFFTKKPYVRALYTLGFLTPLPKHLYNDGQDFNSHPINRAPIGTGPFRFVEWKTGRRIVLERFEKYWGEPYKIEKIFYKLIPDDNVALLLLKKQELDVLSLIPLQWARQTQSEKFAQNFVKHRWFTRFGGYLYIGWNLRRPYFKDKKVRQALAYLIDKNAINEKLLFGLYQPITGPAYPKGDDYDKNIPEIPFSIEKAKQLLTEAGWVDKNGDGIREKNGVPFHFTMIFGSGIQFYDQFTPIIRENFSKAGIDVELRRMEGITLFKMMHDFDFDAYIAGWGRAGGVEDHFQIFHSSQAKGGSNYIGYANEKVDRLIEAARLEFDDDKRTEMNREVHRILAEDQPYLFLYTSPALVVRDKRFDNVKEYPLGFNEREWKIIP